MKEKKPSDFKPPLPNKEIKKVNKPKKGYDKQASVSNIFAFDEFTQIQQQPKKK